MFKNLCWNNRFQLYRWMISALICYSRTWTTNFWTELFRTWKNIQMLFWRKENKVLPAQKLFQEYFQISVSIIELYIVLTIILKKLFALYTITTDLYLKLSFSLKFSYFSTQEELSDNHSIGFLMAKYGHHLQTGLVPRHTLRKPEPNFQDLRKKRTLQFRRW